MSDRNRLAEYSFWKCQYVSRNEDYIRLDDLRVQAQREFFASLSPDSRHSFEWDRLTVESIDTDSRCLSLSDSQRTLLVKAKKLEFELCNRFSVLPHHRYFQSDIILQWAANGIFQKNVIEAFRVWVPWTGLYVTNHDSSDCDSNMLSIAINTNGDFKSVIQEVGRLYLERKLRKSTSEDQRNDLWDEVDDWSSSASVMKSLKKAYPEIAAQGIEHRPRVLGLWLWDYINEQGSSQAKAIQRMREQYDYCSLDVYRVDDADLKRYFRKTRDCIEQHSVLNFDRK